MVMVYRVIDRYSSRIKSGYMTLIVSDVIKHKKCRPFGNEQIYQSLGCDLVIIRGVVYGAGFK